MFRPLPLFFLLLLLITISYSAQPTPESPAAFLERCKEYNYWLSLNREGRNKVEYRRYYYHPPKNCPKFDPVPSSNLTLTNDTTSA